MKRLLVLLFLMLKNGVSEKQGKRFPEQNPTDDSFQVNVSAGYGVHSENVTHPSPVYRFQERKSHKENRTIPSNHQARPSQSITEIFPKYQVHEKNTEMRQKQYHVPKATIHRGLDKRQPNKVNDFDLRAVGSGTKIVEIVRVPAMYELHLQADPQRIASIKSAWFQKLMSPQVRKAPQVDSFGSSKLQQPPNLNYLQASTTNQLPFYQKASDFYQTTKPKFASNQIYQAPVSSLNPQKLAAQASNLQGYKFAKSPLYLPNPTKSTPLKSEFRITVPETTTSKFLSNEIPADFYQKPQALHEVPAPVLDKNSHKFGSFPKSKTAQIPNLVYGKIATTPAPFWGNPEPAQDNFVKQQEPASNSSVQNVANYQEDKYVQNFYNDAIGEHLDQNLANVNGGVTTFMNPDGTMVISNFHHNPKLYTNSYVVPLTETRDHYSSPQTGDFNPFGLNFQFPNPETASSGSQPTDLSKNVNFDNLALSARHSDLRFPTYGNFISRRVFKRPLRKRLEPVDYIIYIKQKNVA